MNLIDWPHLQISSNDWEQIILYTSGVIRARVLLLKLVESLLCSLNWENRVDVVALFDPTQNYEPGSRIALPQKDPQGVRSDSWHLGEIRKVEDASNPIQGSFQVVTILVNGKEEFYAAGIAEAQPLFIQMPSSPEEREMLAAQIVDEHFEALKKKLNDAIEDGLLSAEINGDDVLVGDPTLIGETERELIHLFFAELPEDQFFLTTEDIYRRLIGLSALSDIPKDGALFSLRLCLEEMGFIDLGNDQWVTADAFAKIDRKINRYLPVPRIRTRIQDEVNIDLSSEFENYVTDLGEESEPVKIRESIESWQPPAQSLPIGPLSFMNLREGYFPLASITSAFPPEPDHLLVKIQIAEGDDLLSFLVDRNDDSIKCLKPITLREKLTELGVWAGVRLWLAYQSEGIYRIFPRPLPQPYKVTCKQIWLDEEGNLRASIEQIELQYEADEHIFKADLRLMDPEALELQAIQLNRSIFDCMRAAFPVLAALNPQGRVHYKELFHMVFFQDRMCSPRTVISNLYTYECFSSVGHGYFSYDPAKGTQRRAVRRRSIRGRRSKGSFPPRAIDIEAEPWLTIAQLVGQELKTLKLGELFTVLGLNNKNIVIRASTSRTRTIGRDQIDRAWQHLQNQGELTRAEIQKKYSRFNPAYVAAILSKLPGVYLASISPITLRTENFTLTPCNEENPSLMDQLLEDPERFGALEGVALRYLAEPIYINPDLSGTQYLLSRQATLYARTVAHARIRALLTENGVQALDEKCFNEQVWQFGNVLREDGGAIDSLDSWFLLPFYLGDEKTNNYGPYQSTEINNEFDSYKIIITGNQTWKATTTWGTSLDLPENQRQSLLCDTLYDLIYGPGTATARLERVSRKKDGMGLHTASGILHIMCPQEGIQYGDHSIEAMRKFGFDWPTVSKIDIKYYELYREFCQDLLSQFHFDSLTDVDYFMRLVAEDAIQEILMPDAWDKTTNTSIYTADAQAADVNDFVFPTTEVSEEKVKDSFQPAMERTRSGQIVAPQLLPKLPLEQDFNQEADKTQITEPFGTGPETEAIVATFDANTLPPSVESVVTTQSKVDHETTPYKQSAAEPLPELAAWVEQPHPTQRAVQKKTRSEQSQGDIQKKMPLFNDFPDEEDLDENTQEAFDVLVRDLTVALDTARNAVLQATKENRFGEVRAQAERAENIRTQLETLLLMRNRWGELVQKQLKPEKISVAPQDLGPHNRGGILPAQRLKRSGVHRQTPREEYRIPILKAISELGGKGRPEEVLKAIERMMSHQLTSFDRENLNSGEIRWRKSVRWLRLSMVKEGYLKQDSPYGLWEISEVGRRYLKQKG